MSGFTRDAKRYGDRLVYEALDSKWDRYHRAHCPGPQTDGSPHQRARHCTGDWLDHATAAGFEIVHEDSGYVAITGPGLTEKVDEAALTANALWEAVTGKPGQQDWFEPVK
jgi:hypothetical protein